MIPPRVLGVLNAAWRDLHEGVSSIQLVDGWRVGVNEGVITLRKADMALFPEHDKGPKPAGYKTPDNTYKEKG